MSINTAERRRSVIDFGIGIRGTGMPIPTGVIDVGARSHILNLYPGITPTVTSFFFWRNRGIPATSFQSRGTVSSTWGKASDTDENRFVKVRSVRDE